jgi:uncharacterized protein (TIGR02266 family)
MTAKTNEKNLLVADHPGPERQVLVAVLKRLGYRVTQVDTIEGLRETLDQQTHFDAVILKARLAAREGTDLARSLGSPDRRVILVSEDPPPGGEMVGFVDLTENALLAMGVRVPEVVFAVNDLVFSRQGAPRRKKRIYGGFSATYELDGEWITGGLYNLSSEGAFIETLDPPEPETRILVRFALPGHSETEVRARVTWTVDATQTAGRRSPPGMGVHFENMTEEQKTMIHQFVMGGRRV